VLIKAIATVQEGGVAPGVADAAQAELMRGPDTVDGIAPAGQWSHWWQDQARGKQENAPWTTKDAKQVASA
jgi:phthalate 4,5-dioxygenase